MFYLFHSINKSQTCSSGDICDHCPSHVKDKIQAFKFYLGGKVVVCSQQSQLSQRTNMQLYDLFPITAVQTPIRIKWKWLIKATPTVNISPLHFSPAHNDYFITEWILISTLLKLCRLVTVCIIILLNCFRHACANSDMRLDVIKNVVVSLSTKDVSNCPLSLLPSWGRVMGC